MLPYMFCIKGEDFSNRRIQILQRKKTGLRLRWVRAGWGATTKAERGWKSYKAEFRKGGS